MEIVNDSTTNASINNINIISIINIWSIVNNSTINVSELLV